MFAAALDTPPAPTPPETTVRTWSMPTEHPAFRIEHFDPARHERSDFDCGAGRLNNYLKLSARKQCRRRRGKSADPWLPCRQSWHDERGVDDGIARPLKRSSPLDLGASPRTCPVRERRRQDAGPLPRVFRTCPRRLSSGRIRTARHHHRRRLDHTHARCRSFAVDLASGRIAPRHGAASPDQGSD